MYKIKQQKLDIKNILNTCKLYELKLKACSLHTSIKIRKEIKKYQTYIDVVNSIFTYLGDSTTTLIKKSLTNECNYNSCSYSKSSYYIHLKRAYTQFLDIYNQIGW